MKLDPNTQITYLNIANFVSYVILRIYIVDSAHVDVFYILSRFRH